MKRLLSDLLIVLLATGSAAAYEEKPDLPRGEWLLLEGRTPAAVKWYREHVAEDPTLSEGLAEALASLGAELLAQHQTVEAHRALDEALRLTHDPSRADRIRHLLAYAEGRTTGHAVVRGHFALASGDLKLARTAYEEALRDAQDEFERREGGTLLALLLLLEAAVEPDPSILAKRAAEVWPGEEGSPEDAQQFLRAARANPGLSGRLGDAMSRLDGQGGEQTATLRGLALSLLLRTQEARAALALVKRPGWRGPLQALVKQAERWERAH